MALFPVRHTMVIPIAIIIGIITLIRVPVETITATILIEITAIITLIAVIPDHTAVPAEASTAVAQGVPVAEEEDTDFIN